MNYNNKQYINDLVELFKNSEDITLVLSNKTAFDLAEALEIEGCRFNETEPFSFDEVKKMMVSDVLVISKINLEDEYEYWFEDAYGEDGLKFIGYEEEVVFIEEDILTFQDIIDYVDGYIEIISDGYKKMYELGYNDALKDIKNKLIIE